MSLKNILHNKKKWILLPAAMLSTVSLISMVHNNVHASVNQNIQPQTEQSVDSNIQQETDQGQGVNRQADQSAFDQQVNEGQQSYDSQAGVYDQQNDEQTAQTDQQPSDDYDSQPESSTNDYDYYSDDAQSSSPAESQQNDEPSQPDDNQVTDGNDDYGSNNQQIQSPSSLASSINETPDYSTNVSDQPSLPSYSGLSMSSGSNDLQNYNPSAEYVGNARNDAEEPEEPIVGDIPTDGVWSINGTTLNTYQQPNASSYQSVLQLSPQQLSSGDNKLIGTYANLMNDPETGDEWAQITDTNSPYFYMPNSSNGTWIDISKEHPTMGDDGIMSENANFLDNGSNVGSTELDGYTGEPGYLRDNDIPSGYHLLNNDVNSRMFTYVPGASLTFNVGKDQNYEDLNYVYQGKTLGSHTFTGDIGSTFIIGATPSGIPIGFQVSEPEDDYEYSNATAPVAITPKQATDNLQFTYNGSPVGSATMTGTESDIAANGTNVGATSFRASDASNIPSNYAIINPSQIIPYDGGTHYIPVEKGQATAKVSYMYLNNIEGSTVMNGAYGSTGTVNGTGMNKGWQMVNPGLTFTFNGSPVSAEVMPIQKTDQINYVYNGQTIGTTTMSGDDSETGLPSSSTTIGSNPSAVPFGYQLVNPNQNIQYNGQTQVVTVEPTQSTMTVHLTYLYNGNTVGTQDIPESGAVNQAFNINAQMKVPSGYTLDDNGAALTATMPGTSGSIKNMSVNVAPMSVTDTIDYMYNNTEVGSLTMTGKEGSPGSATGANLPSQYQVSQDGTNNFTFDGQTHDVNVVLNPNANSNNNHNNPAPNPSPFAGYNVDTINYTYNGATVAVSKLLGNSSQTLTIGLHPDNLPDLYKVTNPGASFKYNNGTYDIPVELNEAAPLVCAFVNQHGKVVGYTQPMQDIGRVGQTVNIEPRLEPFVPHGYHLNSNQPINVKLTDNGFNIINMSV